SAASTPGRDRASTSPAAWVIRMRGSTNRSSMVSDLLIILGLDWPEPEPVVVECAAAVAKLYPTVLQRHDLRGNIPRGLQINEVMGKGEASKRKAERARRSRVEPNQSVVLAQPRPNLGLHARGELDVKAIKGLAAAHEVAAGEQDLAGSGADYAPAV